jgi:hypothetical protein
MKDDLFVISNRNTAAVDSNSANLMNKNKLSFTAWQNLTMIYALVDLTKGRGTIKIGSKLI